MTRADWIEAIAAAGRSSTAPNWLLDMLGLAVEVLRKREDAEKALRDRHRREARGE